MTGSPAFSALSQDGKAWVAIIATGLALAALNAHAQDRAATLSNASSLSELVQRLGREPDRSEQGGACGGILVHDWVNEDIRAITLGGLVQTVSTLPASHAPEPQGSGQSK